MEALQVLRAVTVPDYGWRHHPAAKMWRGYVPQEELDLPPWIGDEDVHRSHRSNLLRKDPEFYTPLFPGDPPDLPYVWPAPTR